MSRIFLHLLITSLLCVTMPYTVKAELPSPYAPWPQQNNRQKAIPHTQERDRSINTPGTALPSDRNYPTKEQNAFDLYTADKQKPQPLSALEKIYAERLIDEPKQFGYDMFTNMDISSYTAPMGAVQDDYVLGTGDELQITFTGGRVDQGEYRIDTHGMVQVTEFPPIPAAGRTIAQLRESINAHLQSFHNTQAYISLSSIRQISVLVVGNVKHPGRKSLSMFHTVLDALSLTGGVKKDGSLRRIKLVRNGRSTYIDIYSLLMHGAPHIDMRLKDGDRIIIPPIGPTIAISGAVKRPGIYEIKQTLNGLSAHTKPNSEKLNLNAVLDFAGGPLISGQNRFLKLTLTSDGREIVTEIQDPFQKVFESGTILSVLKGTEKRSGTIELVGHTRRPGLHDLSQNKTLSELLSNEYILGDDIYPLIGVIERWNKTQLITQYISFPLRLVLNNEFDLKLHDNDAINLLSNSDISNIYASKQPNNPIQENQEQGSRFNDINIIDNPELKFFLKERSVTIRGAVRKPGSYPVSDGITLDNILAVAGGMTLEADTSNIEITSLYADTPIKGDGRNGKKRSTIDLNDISPAYVSITSGDSIRINQKFKTIAENNILIIGEVKHPGHYDLLPGDKVSDIIERAGGLSEQAYPAGSIFSRESERKSEEMRFRSAAHDMERRLAAAVERDKDGPNATQIEMVRELAEELSTIEAVGRITVETNPAALLASPELDMYLEKGDRIYIPKRPLTVRVSGEILSPANLQFRKNKDPLDYIHEAGGFTYHADKNRTFVLFPDGSAQPLQVSNWNHRPIFIPPGSTIVIPRDPKPFDFIESAKEVGQILSNLAVTSVFIDDIRD
ncbi:MAG: SLBB domain-containing protein [Alphaproteobacteria bacterium]